MARASRPKMKIGDWQVTLKVDYLAVYYQDFEMCWVPIDMFKEYGMLSFPAILYRKIGKELAAANIYDKFCDKAEHFL